MAEEQAQRTVNCIKLGRELPGLQRPPRNDELGQRIFEKVSAQAWQLWQEQQTILINHYGLNMVDPQAHEFLSQQMEEFFFGEGAQLPEDWVPEGQGGGKGASGGKGAPSSGGKGAPAPARK
ncbi:MAG: oxidative damage protection protein [Anaerolineae bacterium]|nr:oxidative damage protection protein [Anaerolineae bacterium]